MKNPMIFAWLFSFSGLIWAQTASPLFSVTPTPAPVPEGRPSNIAAEIPADILRENERFFTISSENDLFGSGRDRDYTNGIRLTYFDVGRDQPALIHWLDRVLPMFQVNKTTTSYYSLGQNIYTPHDISVADVIEGDRPYAGFLYGSIGVSTAVDNYIDDVELTLGMVGPSALGKQVQTEYHKLIDAEKPAGWAHQISDEPVAMLSWERTYPGLWRSKIGDSLYTRFNPHFGVTLGTVYTYANAGFSLDLMPQDMPWQTRPVRVRPAISGSGFFETPESGHSWMLFAGFDARAVARNIFLDGNTFKDSYSVKKEPIVYDAEIGAAYTYQRLRLSYTFNWRSKEFKSPYSKESTFGSISLNYRF